MSKTTGFQTERTKPFPLTEIDFSSNEITGEGVGDIVQFARTQGSDATKINYKSSYKRIMALTDGKQVQTMSQDRLIQV